MVVARDTIYLARVIENIHFNHKSLIPKLPLKGTTNFEWELKTKSKL